MFMIAPTRVITKKASKLFPGFTFATKNVAKTMCAAKMEQNPNDMYNMNSQKYSGSLNVLCRGMIVIVLMYKHERTIPKIHDM